MIWIYILLFVIIALIVYLIYLVRFGAELILN